ncbi:ATP-dependent RNA helicase DbpA [wastewater metagenome]|uniref:ATP-dependent RNA helicase DbpA n=2 Tax=unclassified sequences TaxID=12908 RepID=A0A5B8RE20_9ZZZZ|nr:MULTISPECIES: DEAD/DEAH box helicase [Arhodomonas]MCS4503021.1 DEAD/DEAH box helicase [Arhodomonas aquaeolei]QEA06148.1 ATP-dependent RNA helicase DbpA [uncultured organism]
MPLTAFHPAVNDWFRAALGEPTAAQRGAWPAIRNGHDTLIAAPTGSGKTLAAFLAALDELVREGLAAGLGDETTVLYVSPLRALSNDIQRNLQVPLAGIGEALAARGDPAVEVRAWVRTGDTPTAERERMRRHPPHIVVTTPESLYILLTSESGRRMLATVRTVIVDEIHALAGNKRGAHLALSLERLARLTPGPPQRIGLSATQKPIEDIAAFLSGERGRCEIVDTGHVRERDLAVEVPDSPLAAVMSNEVWEEIYDRLAGHVDAHRTTLIFVNTRRLAERAARHLAERLGDGAVTAHHGSLAREHRLDAEQRLKRGELRALVATASLELGIDIGEVDLVCQLGSPRGIGAVLQRVGRSGHGLGRLPRGRLFPLSRDDLVECTALLDCVHRGELDRIHIPDAPLDVLAQQIVAETAAAGEWGEQALYEAFAAAWPYRGLTRETFTGIVRMLAEGITTRRGRRGAYLHRDAVNARLRPRRSARLVALTNGGAIPDQFDYDVLLQPEGLRVGSVNEDFAFESVPGDVFQLGNTAYRILKVESGRVLVEDAGGMPPNLPFWFGEAPARSEELSAAVSRLRADVDQRLAASDNDPGPVREWLMDAHGLPAGAAAQLADYLAIARVALGVVPTRAQLAMERFFDEAGDMHLVIHSPYGSRINRAWGLALRKRFCRRFNFELQAAALEDSIVLSLGPTHSFPLDEVARYLASDNAREVLTQALLDAPLFATRWRWVATVSLAVRRSHGGRRRPAQLQRQDAEDLLSVVFPDQLACAENLAGAREIPEHPLVTQTLHDCLAGSLDVDGLEALLKRLERGEVTVTTRDLAAPSPLAEEVINARPYAFLDDGAQEERRTLSIAGNTTPGSPETWARPDAAAVARVCAEVWPRPRDADELHDALVTYGFLTADEGTAGEWRTLFEQLATEQRAGAVSVPGGGTLWVAAERLVEMQALYPDTPANPAIDAVGTPPADADAALTELLRSRLEGLGPVTAAGLAAPLGVDDTRVAASLARLETEGFAIQGRFTADAGAVQWCERGLLARIQRYSLQRRRSRAEPVAPRRYLRFLVDWHGLGERGEGVETLAGALEQLEGFPVPARAWEGDLLPARVADYTGSQLDQLLTTGRFAWLRLNPPRAGDDGRRHAAPVRNTPISLIERENLVHWRTVIPAPQAGETILSGGAERVLAALREHGASFFADLVAATGMLRTQVEEALAELVAVGLVTADTFDGLRALIAPSHKRPSFAPRGRRRRRTAPGVDAAGRWAALPGSAPGTDERRRMTDLATLEHIARVLLRRYGVVFRRVLAREQALPPWRELLYVFRLLEARGEVHGGRFVDQFAGEQFAHPDAVGALARYRHAEPDDTLVVISAADPVNLMGIVTPGGRIPASPANRILLRDGAPVAAQIGGEVHYLETLPPEAQWDARTRLVRRAG